MKRIFATLIAFSLSSCIDYQRPRGAITAKDSLVMAIASDLRTYNYHREASVPELLDEIYGAAVELYQLGIVSSRNQGWLLQPGIWRNHRDYKYSGHTTLPSRALCSNGHNSGVCNLSAKPTDGIGMDVSHFLAKWPIFLTSFKEASYDKPENRAFFSEALQGLEVTLFTKVITPGEDSNHPPYLFTNYMDGTNGIYRWNFEDRGKDSGYEPFQLSSTPCYSSLLLLDSERIREMYQAIYESLPYPSEVTEFIGNSQCNRDGVKLLTSLSSKFSYAAETHSALIGSEEEQLFQTEMAESLMQPDAWIGWEAYKSVVGQRQAVLHIAFAANQQAWIDVFDQHFENFLETVSRQSWESTSEYQQQHYLLFVSRYLALSAIYQHRKDFHSALYQYLYDRLESDWNSDYAVRVARKIELLSEAENKK